ncbi:hypothetical protein SDC9_184763 [bioreactor metagenome]|uniref:Uncharacterized protein n=1 Tax=bioreactor metagenome TaxID=1076179 RepID=A0A645HDY6_9ZZZZ
MANVPVDCQGRSAVKAKPCKPQDEHAQSAQCQGMAWNGIGRAVFIVFTDTRPDHDSAHQGNPAAD